MKTKLQPKIKRLFSIFFVSIRRNWLKLLIALVILLGLAGFIFQKKTSQKADLTFINPEVKTLTKTLDVSGVVDAKEKARLRFAVGGKVIYLGAKEGDLVKKWQTIATIDQTTLQKQLQQDLNLYMKERWDWENTQDSIKNQSLDTSERRSVDQQQWDLSNEVLDVEIRDIAIQNTNLTAPFTGILTFSPTQTTGIQLLGSDYFEVVNPDSLIFRVAIDEIDIAGLELGQSAEIKIDAFPDQTYNSELNYIAFTSNESSTGTVFLAELPLQTAGNLGMFRLGMNGDATIKLKQKDNVLVIPLDATRERDGEVFVDVRTGEETYEERKIITGMETDDELEVLEGLNENDQVLLPE